MDTRLSPGDIVGAFQNLIRIANPDALYVVYNGSNLSNFTMGAEVEVTIDEKLIRGR